MLCALRAVFAPVPFVPAQALLSFPTGNVGRVCADVHGTGDRFAPCNAGVVFHTDILIPLAGFTFLWLQRRPGGGVAVVSEGR